jgi:pseudaminic acid cytidylyltransferase
MRIAVIPARGGSKRIPRKNIRPFGGQPIIAWSISAAQQSGCFDRIVVSTDDDEIAQVARFHGAQVPFMRPSEISNDHAATIPVIAHAIAWQNANGEQVSDACCIYPTAPFVQAQDLQKGLMILQENDADYVMTVTSFAFPIQRALRITPEKRVQMFQPQHACTRSQDLEESWHDAGQFYWGKASSWLENKPIFSSNSSPLILSRERVQDIDTSEDWKVAEMKFSLLFPNLTKSEI